MSTLSWTVLAALAFVGDEGGSSPTEQHLEPYDLDYAGQRWRLEYRSTDVGCTMFTVHDPPGSGVSASGLRVVGQVLCVDDAGLPGCKATAAIPDCVERCASFGPCLTAYTWTAIDGFACGLTEHCVLADALATPNASVPPSLVAPLAAIYSEVEAARAAGCNVTRSPAIKPSKCVPPPRPPPIAPPASPLRLDAPASAAPAAWLLIGACGLGLALACAASMGWSACSLAAPRSQRRVVVLPLTSGNLTRSWAEMATVCGDSSRHELDESSTRRDQATSSGSIALLDRRPGVRARADASPKAQCSSRTCMTPAQQGSPSCAEGGGGASEWCGHVI